MYDLIYDFIKDNLLNTTYLSAYHQTIMGVDTTLEVWLSHFLTIMCIVILTIGLIFVVRWFFKLGANLLTFR